MAPRNKRKTSQIQLTDSNKILKSHHDSNNDQSCSFEADRLSTLLNSFQSAIESERRLNKVLPDKLWYKGQFAVGVNEVTRLLECMSPSVEAKVASPLQAVLIASDCNPKWLTKHLPNLASSRSVPLIYVKDKKEGSLRLGELVKIKTAIAIGVKAKGSNINEFIVGLLNRHDLNGTRCLESTPST